MGYKHRNCTAVAEWGDVVAVNPLGVTPDLSGIPVNKSSAVQPDPQSSPSWDQLTESAAVTVPRFSRTVATDPS
eukprot:m.112687 g.112687  ORF g.112687 m.112687 type:complete len:74 (+) comp12983_c0_seq1:178-399(+)